MISQILSLLCTLALVGATIAQAQYPPLTGPFNPDDPNYPEYSVLTKDSFTGVFTFKWWGAAGRTYFIQHTEDLNSWNFVPVIESGNNDFLEWELTADSPRGFVRLLRSDFPTADPFNADFDGDKVRNFNEVWNNTDPLRTVDSDTDGMADDWERFFFQTLARNGAGDYDADGRSDAQEYSLNSDPSDFFNGAPPQIVLISGNNQSSGAGEFLASPLVIEVRNGSGTPLVNAPVSFFVSHGAGQLYQTQAGAGVTRIDTLRTGADGRASLFFRLGFSSDPTNIIRAGALSRFNGYKLVEFTASQLGINDLPVRNALAVWLNADSLAVALGSAIPTWNDQSGSNKNAIQVSGSAATTLPTLVTDGIRAVRFDGVNDRLTLGSDTGQNDFTVITLFKPEATRTAHSPATNYGSRNAGTTGQRYLLAGAAGSGSNIWPAPQPAKPAARVYSVWQYKDLPGSGPFWAYNYDPLPNLRWTSAVEKRYDDTDDDRNGNNDVVNRSNNDGDGNGPGLNDDQSDSYWRTRFENYVGSSYFQNWSTEHFKVKDNHQKTYVYLGQTIVSWEEDYYEYRATTYQLPYLQDSSQPNTALIGTVGAGISAGSNGIGCYELRSDYNPAKANASYSATGWQVASIRYSGKQAKIYAQGVLSTGAASQAGTVKGPQFIGGSPSNGDFFQGKVAEILIFNRALDDGERELVEDYLAERAGVTVIDRDGDSLPDWWERQWFDDLDELGSGNLDGDGFTNAQEFARGLNPKSADTDQDGLRDDVEVNTTGTNPLLADTDGDGFPDGYEVAHPPLNPLSASDGLADKDGNGIPDGWDFINNFDRATTDSDGDGLLDWQEILSGANAYGSADSNGDGISDRAAYLSGVSAFNLDHDGDGVLNSDELIRGTNPFLADSDGDGVNDFADAFPLDPTRTSFGTPNPSDVTPPVVIVERPPDAQLLPP